ncbi:uncharacterized protein N7525_008377 [Penicillium rubens]|uniref:uncharacterized protein n=1 Tax=Penicillium rubens TaxID=1108849 RepID=UPI002A5B0D16|nr:uncharacterized protein N7525_008377 [Penicillium rubens]KAJ5830124.1 hypothetical protein N7525_008377 [Penicillium rubens]
MGPLRVYLFLACFLSATMAIPQQTGSITTAAAPAVITQGPELLCSDGQTAVYTTDCTMGTPISYCFSQEPPLECPQGSFPSVWHPDHCMEQSSCFPLSEPWITTKCSNGAIPYSTSTIYQGTLVGGESTVIRGVSCSCATNQWYSMTLLPGSSNYDTFCMPYSYCPRGMTTSVSINEYCATKPVGVCSDIPLEANLCQCASPAQTPVYPDWPGANPTGCEYLTR